MNRLMMAIGLLLLIASGSATAQSGTSSGSSAGRPLPTREAPVGHRQVRPGDVPDEKNLSNPNDQANKEDAALDRKIKSICRGC